jgi:hypothetical protein
LLLSLAAADWNRVAPEILEHYDERLSEAALQKLLEFLWAAVVEAAAAGR